MDKQVCIGTIVAPHGVRGDIRILPQTEHPEQFLDLDYLLLENGRTLHLTNARFHKRMVLIKCREVNNMNEAEVLRGQKVFIYTEDLPELEEGQYYYHELMHCTVYNEEKEKLGEVVDILETGANLVLRVKSKGNSFLLPFVPAFIVDVNKEAHEITIREMEGLR